MAAESGSWQVINDETDEGVPAEDVLRVVEHALVDVVQREEVDAGREGEVEGDLGAECHAARKTGPLACSNFFTYSTICCPIARGSPTPACTVMA